MYPLSSWGTHHISSRYMVVLWPLRISEQALCHTVPCVVGGDRRSSTQTFHGVHMRLIGQARRDRVSGLSVGFSKLSYIFTQDTYIHTTYI